MGHVVVNAAPSYSQPEISAATAHVNSIMADVHGHRSRAKLTALVHVTNAGVYTAVCIQQETSGSALVVNRCITRTLSCQLLASLERYNVHTGRLSKVMTSSCTYELVSISIQNRDLTAKF